MTTGIQGNTETQRQEASTARTSDKETGKKRGVNFGIVLILLLSAVVLSLSDVGFFGGLLAVAALFIASNASQKFSLLNSWSSVLKSLGWVALAIVLLSSGYGTWLEGRLNNSETAAYCRDHPEESRCLKRQADLYLEEQSKKAAEKAKRGYNRQVIPQTVTPALLGPEAYEQRRIGYFQPVVVRSGNRVGPINQYDGSCMYVVRSGLGKLQVYSRPDFTSTPVPAVMASNGVGVNSWGHDGPAYQVFYEANGQQIRLELERRSGNNSCQ